MNLTDWIVILAIALLSIAFFTIGTPLRWSPGHRARRAASVRMLVQVTVAVWLSFVIVGRDLLYAQSLLADHLAPHTLVITACALMGCGVWWTFRPTRLLRTRQMFVSRWR